MVELLCHRGIDVCGWFSDTLVVGELLYALPYPCWILVGEMTLNMCLAALYNALSLDLKAVLRSLSRALTSVRSHPWFPVRENLYAQSDGDVFNTSLDVTEDSKCIFIYIFIKEQGPVCSFKTVLWL